ncbi:hypothetical protein CLTEP_22350 [Clostridium tepidiprofundi DSM 19306]|uniref:Uncharacterized protein n=1 Tax=Clostridium tepidiprofundi DSM 19306 TaxID=1121338 RepID=A0A151AXQ3_9CLOT|nr:DUF6137 domain-containing protein [Clostridium tepidiprofundi]KYH32439.1 hypothetical protein CLTEP_22350 [Clostridium tepidiprofundi DSM 19306]
MNYSKNYFKNMIYKVCGDETNKFFKDPERVVKLLDDREVVNIIQRLEAIFDCNLEWHNDKIDLKELENRLCEIYNYK